MPNGSPGWIRTSDHSINSRMLCREATEEQAKPKGFATGQRITKPPSLAKREMGRSGATSGGNQNDLSYQGLSAFFDEPKIAVWRPVRRFRKPAMPGTEPQKDAFAADNSNCAGVLPEVIRCQTPRRMP